MVVVRFHLRLLEDWIRLILAPAHLSVLNIHVLIRIRIVIEQFTIL